MSEHERRADDLERQLDEMQERSERLEDEIDDTRDDWERKKRDSGVPGAAGAPERADDDEGAPEQDYPTKR
jgi:predicted  nucleic acid-binding Zn-ribbon protein